MFDGHVRRRLAAVSVSLASMLAVAACGAPATTVAPSLVATTAPSATVAPTPSPSAADVSAAFVKVATAPDFSATGRIDGTLTIGAVDGVITGDGAFDGPNSMGSITLEAGTFRQVTNSVRIGSESWTQKEPGPWLMDPGASTSKGLDDYMRSVTTVIDLGVETYAGRQLHHLEPTAGNEVSPDLLGFDVGTATDAAFTADFYAADDGTPAIIAISGSWTQASGATSVETTMAFDLVFSNVGEPQVINPPEDVWVRYASDLGYTMAHPPDWTVQSKKNQDAYLLNDQGYVYVAVTPYKGSTAKFAGELKASYRKPFKGDPESEAATVLGGQAAVRLIYQYRNDEDQDVTIADDVVSRDGIGWEVFLATAGGPEDIEVFDQFVATFQFTD